MDITHMSSIMECNEPNAAFEKFTEICPSKLLGALTTACKRANISKTHLLKQPVMTNKIYRSESKKGNKPKTGNI